VRWTHSALTDAEHVMSARAAVLVVPIEETAQDAEAIRAVENTPDDLKMDL